MLENVTLGELYALENYKIKFERKGVHLYFYCSAGKGDWVSILDKDHVFVHGSITLEQFAAIGNLINKNQ